MDETVNNIDKNKEILLTRYQELSRAINLESTNAEKNKGVFFLFKMNENTFAIAIEEIAEIVEYAGATPIPNLTKNFLGIINLRGEIVSVVDISDFILNRSVEIIDEIGKIIVINMAEYKCGFIISEILEKITISNEEITNVNLEMSHKQFTTTVLNWNMNNVPIINIKQLLSLPDFIVEHQ
jgi:purine-binding chemotaxis protein CheW